ncbi:hypothetical protein BT69DRAFT_1117416 [Atractiella rhizophila]|nr:hypothetical protein BT69DRAFT_1117416 [Atractiella rhizophila]
MSSRSTNVQLRLESHLPCLRDFVKLKLFSPEEISQITARRKKLMLHLDGGMWEDWRRMIDFESGLEEVRKRRVRRRKIDIREAKSGKGKGREDDLPVIPKKSASSFFLPAYINRLYHTAAHRFPLNNELHASHIQYLLSLPSPSTQQISRLLTSCVLRSPMSSFWWIESIRWECSGAVVLKRLPRGDRLEEVDVKIGGGNWDGARKLCMRALRFLKDEGDEGGKIWREWVMVEEQFRRVVEGRKAAFGLLEGEEEVEGTQPVEMKGHDAIVDGHILKAVLRHFVETFPSHPNHYKSMLSHLRSLYVPTPIVDWIECKGRPD